jgi:hypothetical protein
MLLQAQEQEAALLSREHPIYRLNKSTRIDRFDHNILKPAHEKLFPVALHGERGACHQWDRSKSFIDFELLRNLEARFARQPDIHKDQVGSMLTGFQMRGIAICDPKHSVAALPKNAAYQLAVERIVFNDENRLENIKRYGLPHLRSRSLSMTKNGSSIDYPDSCAHGRWSSAFTPA